MLQARLLLMALQYPFSIVYRAWTCCHEGNTTPYECTKQEAKRLQVVELLSWGRANAQTEDQRVKVCDGVIRVSKVSHVRKCGGRRIGAKGVEQASKVASFWRIG